MPHLPDSQHAAHDLELIAAYAAGDATERGLERATQLVASCADCADLHHDLRSIAVATAAIPAPVRTRDFRLTSEQAAALRPSGVRGLLATLSGPRFSFATPVGTGLAALGIVGVLVASGGLPTGGGSAAAPQVQTATTGEQRQDAEAAGIASAAAASPAPDQAPPASAAPSAVAEQERATLSDEESPGGDTAGGGEGAAASAEATADALASEPPASPRADLYAATDPSAHPFGAAGIASQPDKTPEATVAAPAATSTVPAPPLAAGAALIAAAGIVLVLLRWGARRVA
ncbi:MAG TPA: hypothetical protein VKB30_01820, partial [Candidatus Limnocylindrales bacterium]|nr:hypothetical protein [Candidatus Limnocylindrales bacterium]